MIENTFKNTPKNPSTSKNSQVIDFIDSAIDNLNMAKVLLQNGKRLQGKIEIKSGFNNIFSALVAYGSTVLTAEQWFLGGKK